MCFVSPVFLLNVRNNAEENKNNERERILFCLQMGISSIIGMRRDWCATTQDMMKARMFGFATFADMEKYIKAPYTVKWLKNIIAKYTTRRVFTGLLNTILERGWCKTIVGTPYRRTIISVTKEIDYLETDIREYFKRKPGIEEKRKLDRGKATYFINYKPKE